MLTPQDVRSVQFEKNLRGYRTEDVDHFLDKVEQQLEQDAEQMETLRKQVADLTAENETLRRNMQSYEADGDMLKSALINAQRRAKTSSARPTRRPKTSCTVQICAATTSSGMPTSCCRRPATAPMRSSARPTTRSWPRSGSMTASVSKSPASSPTC